MSALSRVFVFLLSLSVVFSVEFATVYEWDDLQLDHVPPADTTNGTRKPQKIEPQYMAVYKDRLFFSLSKRDEFPVTLVSIPTSNANSAPPKLSPFPTWQTQNEDGCNSVRAARGLEVDSKGRLWALDKGSGNCGAKIWVFSLADDDKIDLVHQFPETIVPTNYRGLGDIALDETADDVFAYVVDYSSEQIIVLSRSKNVSWAVKTHGKEFVCLALSPEKEDRQLYLRRSNSNEMYAVSVSELRGKSQNAALKWIGEWTVRPYRMLIDDSNVLYAAFWNHRISTWNVSESFNQRNFYQTGYLGILWPFTLALDEAGTLWVTERNENDGKSTLKLLKAAVGTRSSSSTAASTDLSSRSSTAPGLVSKSDEKSGGCESSTAGGIRQGRVLINILISLAEAGKLQNLDKRGAGDISISVP